MADLAEAQVFTDKMVQSCFDATDALDCIVETIKVLPDVKGLCKPEVILFTAKDCRYCEDTRITYTDYLRKGEIKELDINSDKGSVKADTAGITDTPALVILDCNNQLLGEVYRDDDLDPLN